MGRLKTRVTPSLNDSFNNVQEKITEITKDLYNILSQAYIYTDLYFVNDAVSQTLQNITSYGCLKSSRKKVQVLPKFLVNRRWSHVKKIKNREYKIIVHSL